MADSSGSSNSPTLARFASGGSGSTSTPSSASSAPNLLFAVPLLVLGLSLLFLSRRCTRLRASIGLGLCAALLAWAITVSRQGTGYLVGNPAGSAIPNDLAIWGITAALFVLGAVTGATFLWPLGLAALAVASGFAFALSILLQGSHGLIPSQGGRWGWLAGWGVVNLVLLAFIPVKYRQWVELAQSCITGAFIFSLSVDLLANGAEGASIGLRWILDTNTAHLAVLSYTPKLSTQLLMALSWIVAPVAAYAQYRLFPVPQPWPARTWFQSETAQGDIKDEGTDGSPASSTVTSSDDLEAEKTMLRSPIRSENHSDISEVRGITPSRRTGTSPRTSMVYTQPQHRKTRRSALADPAARQSYPTIPSRAHLPCLNPGVNMRNNRNASAYPLPSLSQLMAYDDAQRAIIGECITETGSGTGSGSRTWLMPSPPNSRTNTRRNSALPYSLPALPLGAHEEDQRAEEQPKNREYGPAVDASQATAGTSSIQVMDRGAIFRDDMYSQPRKTEETIEPESPTRSLETSHDISSGHPNLSGPPTTMTRHGNVPENAERVPAESATNIVTTENDQSAKEKEEDDSLPSSRHAQRILSLPMQGGTVTGNNSSGTITTNELTDEALISRTPSRSSLSTSSLETSISDSSTSSKDINANLQCPDIGVKMTFPSTGVDMPMKVIYQSINIPAENNQQTVP